MNNIMFGQYLLERIMEVGIRVGFGMLAEECRGLTRDEDQHPQEKQLNREVRELKQRLRAKEAQIERLKSSLSVAIVSIVIISCLFIGSNMSSGQNVPEVRPPCNPSSSEPKFGPNRFDFDFEADRRSLQMKLKNERIPNQQEDSFHLSSKENYPSDFSKNKYEHLLYEEELDVILKKSRTAAADESLLFTFFREVWKVVPGVLVVFVTSVLDESCTETKIDFLPVFSIFASFIIIVYGSVFGFSSYLLYDLWNTIMPGVILLFSLIGSDLEE